ncbi:ABC transporter ATP-binding protein [Catellatospora tritici]|uniref:ABC transporter ATP-binding protein n=1 Tax=Catellatospora tritici TaxID=2851566 RepID=UPI001C2CD70A|nr:ABC transporter ATP-binding protein [Catellatospora tritici]MBV1850825.1 ABC transporter ATP-binding protein [Catellatospora tritici]MBV1851078.1 ABC transporter ATP-binding protein [Catellatospora tritici]
MASGVSVRLGSRTVLDRLDLTVDEGEIVALSGVNGTGKSTLLRCLSGLLSPTAGTISVWGAPPDAGPGFWRAVGLVAEEPAWYPGLTAREHLDLVRLTHEPLAEPLASVAEVLELFELVGHADASPLTLSSGQRQRLALAAVWVRPSRLLLLDEPERKLDQRFRGVVAGMLRAYADGGGTVVVATHDPGLAVGSGARMLSMSQGRLSAAVVAG